MAAGQLRPGANTVVQLADGEWVNAVSLVSSGGVVPGQLSTVTVTIANGASLSDQADLGAGMSLVGILPDSAWDTNVMSFTVATASGGTFNPLYTAAGTEVVTGSIVASRQHAVDPVDFLSSRYIKVRSGTAAAAVNQAGATVITLIVRVV